MLFQFAFCFFKLISRGFPFKNENIPTHGRLLEAGLPAGGREITNAPTAKLGDSKNLSSSFLSLRSASHPLVTNLPDQDCTESLRPFRKGHGREAVAEAVGRSGGHCKNGPFPLWGLGKLSLTPLILLAGRTIQITHSRLLGENLNFNTCAWGIRTSRKIPKTVRQNEVSMTFWTKEKRVTSSGIFKGK